MTRAVLLLALLAACGCAKAPEPPAPATPVDAAINEALLREHEREMQGTLLLRMMEDGADSVLIVGRDFHIGLHQTHVEPNTYRVTLYRVKR